MQRTLKTLGALSVLVLLSPMANATWMFAQSYEPDTSYDTPNFMWPDAPEGNERRIYFAAFSMHARSGVNPNVGALQTSIEIPNDEFHEALFGVWVDCNGDGYVGMAETAVREYNRNLLLDTSVCPHTTGSNQKWIPGAHNYNNLVTELIPIARQPTNRDVRVYQDDEARVWGDFHRPDERPWFRSCPLRPLPRGTLESVGGVLNYVDCRQDVLGTFNLAVGAIGDPAGLRFGNEDDARSGALGAQRLLGPESDSHSAAQVWDCGQPHMFRSGDTLNESGLGPITADTSGGGPVHNVRVHVLSPGIGNLADPTVPGTVNHTVEGMEDCDTSNDFGHDVYNLAETDFNGVDPNNKREADWNFGFTTSNRGGFPVSLLGPFGGSGSAGMNENDYGLLWGGSRWVSDSAWLSKPGFGTLRVDIASANAEIAPGHWLTFYAYAGSATRLIGAAFPGGEDVYGAYHCGEHTSGIHRGWNCDASAWYINPDGTPVNDPDNELVRPGQRYQFRDVDCYDGRIGGTGIGLQPAFYGAYACT